jgi:GH43 family beta-xylosidase
MAASVRDAAAGATYLNPVHRGDFPDPFVLRFAGEYWAYCTGLRADGRAFGVMRSRDLVRWHELAGALAPLHGSHPCYWAPEVVFRGGRFLMYYSVGNETLMQLRVAVSARPEGPFEDSGRRLTAEKFAIDPHVFADSDGARYLFYATDFLTHTHVGTGTVVDRLLDDFTLEGRPRPVTRARYDWQVYDPARKEKGGVRWHTVEGPTVLGRKGRYYEMFSGGNWQNVTYGVSYAVSDRLLRDGEWEQHADGERVLPILRTIPGEVAGPGHNSVARGPDGRQLYCVYHRWDGERGRVLAIDPLEFVGERLAVLGPSTTPQPAPAPPSFADHFDAPQAAGLGHAWDCARGRWSVSDGEARQSSGEGAAEARCRHRAASFVAEVALRALEEAAPRDSEKNRRDEGRDDARDDGRDEIRDDGRGDYRDDGREPDSSENSSGGSFGVVVDDDVGAAALRFAVEAGRRRASVSRRAGGAWEEVESFDLPADFRQQVFHELRIEVDERFVSLTLDGNAASWSGTLDQADGPAATPRAGRGVARLAQGRGVALFTDGAAAAFKGFTLSRGFEEDFARAGAAARGWRAFDGGAGRPLEDPPSTARAPRDSADSWRVLRLAHGEGVFKSSSAVGPRPYELVVNVRAESDGLRADDSGAVSLYSISPGPALDDETIMSFVVERRVGAWSLALWQGESAGEARRISFALPAGFDPFEFQQLRFRCEAGRVVVRREAEVLGEVASAGESGRVAVSAWGASVALDLVRLTAL